VSYLGKPIGVARDHEALEPGRASLTAEQRAALWNEIAPKLSVEVATKALNALTGGSITDITHVVTTNTSGWAEPGLSAHLIHSLGL